MAASYTSRSYVIKLMEVLARSSTPMTAVDLHGKVFASAGAAPLARAPKMSSFEATLRALQKLGVTAEYAGQWSMADPRSGMRRQVAREFDDDVGADGGRRGPPKQNGGGEGSDNRGGIVEVLEHPVLLCYAADHFEQAVDNCLQVYGN